MIHKDTDASAFAACAQADESGGVLSRDLSAEQKAAVYAETNTVVAAGAGSGKTTVLAERFAYLVTHGTPEHRNGIKAERILTLTFTKKAAAEMHERIYRTLHKLTESADPQVSSRAQEAVKSFGSVHIQTLDSYCSSVVRQGAYRYGIRPDFTVDAQSGGAEETAAQMALEFFMEHRHEPALQQFLASVAPETAAGSLLAEPLLMYSSLDKPLQFAGDLARQAERVRLDWPSYIGAFFACIKEIQKHMTDDDMTEKLQKDLDAFFARWPSAISEDLIAGAAFSEYLSLTEAAASGKKTAAAAQSVFADRLRVWIAAAASLPSTRVKKSAVCEPLRQAKEVLEQITVLAAFILQYGLLFDTALLMEEFQRVFLQWKRASGSLSFQDVARLAVVILTEQKDIRQNEKCSFDAIMIDEFQDNNSLQKDLLYLLAERRDLSGSGIPRASDIEAGKLFFVGDEKQSIYRFRGADVSVFRALQNELSSGEPLCLRTNYRSQAALIRACNVLFAGCSGSAERKDACSVPASIFLRAAPQYLPAYEARPEPALIPAEKEADAAARTHVCLYFSKRGKGTADVADSEHTESVGRSAEELSPKEAEAVYTVRRIRELIAEGSYAPGDIAILLGRKTNQHLYEKYLRMAGIAYQTENISSFFSDAPVNDMLHMLRLLAYPADVLSYGAVLSSPFAELSFAGAMTCLQYAMTAPDPADTCRPVPFDEGAEALLSDGDAERYCRGRAVYRSLLERAQTGSLTLLVSALWYETGYRYETMWSDTVCVYQELYDYVYELARLADEDGQTLAWFADTLYRIRDGDDKLDELSVPLKRKSAVTIITIHKSKGLQYPVVFVCDAGSKSRGRERQSYAVQTKEFGVCIQPPKLSDPWAKKGAGAYFIQKEQAEQKAMDIAERRRRLYVALTRAEQELYVTACINAEDDLEKTAETLAALYVEKQKEKQQKKDAETGLALIPVYGPYSQAETVLHSGADIDFMLPVICEWNKSAQSYPLFTLERILPCTRSKIPVLLGERQTRFADKHAAKLRSKPFYEQVFGIGMQEAVSNRCSPSLLARLADTGQTLPTDTPPVRGYEQLDAVLQRHRERMENGKAGFSAAEFGTIVHEYSAALIAGTQPEIPAQRTAALSPAEQTVVLAAAKDMAARFLETPLGQQALHADLRKSEYTFRSIVKRESGEPVYIDGVIDLLFVCGDTVYVVDFKTDSQIAPAAYISQLACYRDAALRLCRASQCRTLLYYLRHDRAVDITAETAACELRCIV